jgi:ariadne-1
MADPSSFVGNLGIRQTIIRCTCSHPFCFKCGEEAHDPVSCGNIVSVGFSALFDSCHSAQLSDWLQKCMSESETANWILANTKKCPNCNTRIEKNQGTHFTIQG